jgi:myo-inositol-1(or 4)-monophosphatase
MRYEDIFNIDKIIKTLEKVAEYQMGKFGHVSINYKAAKELVTEADIESEKMLAEFVTRDYPGHGFIGEEVSRTKSNTDYYWVVDPLDGTSNFVNRLIIWGPSIGIYHNGMPIMGFIFLPVLNRLYFAIKGKGAFCNREKIRSSPAQDYDKNKFIGLSSHFFEKYVIRLPCKIRMQGSACSNIAFLAQGSYVAFYSDEVKFWDIAAGIMIVQESGGIIQTIEGNDLVPIDLEKYSSETYNVVGMANSFLPRLSNYIEPAMHSPSISEHGMNSISGTSY